ncbi:phytoene desaturase family protein [Hyunsoonleella rubra]|uniref:Phytoene desaturase family protein n=1 Tax=Hyunsoonleella rubra TaxID=1737062 RepID=A0ABW5T851_9FLAO
MANCAIPLVPNMLAEPHASSLKQKINTHTNSCSLLNIYVAFKTNIEAIGVKHYSNYFRGVDVKSLKDVHPNHKGDWDKRSFIFVDYGKVDAQLGPANKSVGSICSVDYLKDWEDLTKEAYKAKKEEVAQTLFQRLENRFPGFIDSIEYYEVSTPKTIKRYTSNPNGSVYGYAQTKLQSASKRLRNNFLIPNLYFASAWAFPGGGFEGSIMGGFLTALQMKKDKIWSECDNQKYVDERVVELLDHNMIDDTTIQLDFEKPVGYHPKNGQYAIFKLLDPKEIELDLPYRWLPVASDATEDSLRFHIKTDKSSFSKSCELLDIGDKALVLVPKS